MKMSQTPIILATFALGSPALAVPLNAFASPNLVPARSPAIARSQMLGSPATREGSGSRHSIPVYRKRTVPTSTSSATLQPTASSGLSGLGFDLPVPVLQELSGVSDNENSTPSRFEEEAAEDIVGDATPTIKSMYGSAAAATFTPFTVPLSTVEYTLEDALNQVEHFVDEDPTPKPSSSATMSNSRRYSYADDQSSANSRHYRQPHHHARPEMGATRAAEDRWSSAASSLDISLATDEVASATVPIGLGLGFASSVTSSATIQAISTSAAATVTSAPAALGPLKHHFNPFQDSAPFSVVPPDLQRPGWVYADDISPAAGSEYEAQTVSQSSTSAISSASNIPQ